jgi:hypothetical protein
MITPSIANYEDSHFSGRTSAWSQAQVQVQVQRGRRQPPEHHLPNGRTYRTLQPVAIQPKKPVATTGELCLCLAPPGWLWPVV